MRLQNLLVEDGLHFKKVDIVSALKSVASQEGNDVIEYSLMHMAADHIEDLRKELKRVIAESPHEVDENNDAKPQEMNANSALFSSYNS